MHNNIHVLRNVIITYRGSGRLYAELIDGGEQMREVERDGSLGLDRRPS